MILISLVKGFEGECKPHDLNTNSIYRRTDGRTTGFFKRVKTGWFGIKYKYGKEFNGYIGSDGKVRTTEGIYSSSQFI